MLERLVKFFLKAVILVFTLFGVRYLLAIIGIIIPLEWFIIMLSGMCGYFGILIIIFYAISKNIF